MHVDEKPGRSGETGRDRPVLRPARHGDRTWMSVRGPADSEATGYWCVYNAVSGTWEREEDLDGK